MQNYKMLFALLLSLGLSNLTYANPVLDNIAHGDVSIQQSPNNTIVNQTTDRAIINWQSFNIGANETTHFQQPQGGIALNRISPTQGASEIYGRLTATGQIILINPAGVYFGPSAYVNVGGLIASTANISDQNFLQGIFNFNKVDGYSGSVINQGTIIAANHGLVALIGSAVSNEGLVVANAGRVVLGSGEAFTLSFAGNDLINFTVNQKSRTRGLDKDGHPLADGIKNTGSLIANGGSILVSAQVVKGVLDNVINMRGVAQARSFAEKNGEIVLFANRDGGRIAVAATLDASGSNSSGGNIIISGGDILLEPAALLDVSGDLGGGNINIGGNRYGAGPLTHADNVEAAFGARLAANAIIKGNGGEIIVWSDGKTDFHANISAKGGILAGNGGFVETSGHQLNVRQASIDLKAPQGNMGTWLLDPADITICSGVGCVTETSFNNNTFGALTNSMLDVGDLIAALSSASVIVQTTSSGTGGLGDIHIDAPITWGQATNLTLSAYHDIIGTASITNTGGASVNLIADNSGIGSGTVSFSAGNQVSLSGPGTVNIYYNPVVFGTPDIPYLGGTSPHNYMWIHSLGAASDTTTRSLASLANNSALWVNNYALSKNIDASNTTTWNAGAGFSPIGNAITPFSGKFDGLGNEITNIFIDRSVNTGLFGVTALAAIISNLGITGSVSGTLNTGMLIGQNQGQVNSVYSSGSVTSTSNQVGGLIGLNAGGGIINDAYSLASVSAPTGSAVGGLVGSNAGTIHRSFATGMTTGLVLATGGLVGNNSGTINNSFWDTDSSGIAVGVGTNSGSATVAGGCFGGVCTNGGTVDLTSSINFTGIWDMTNTWGLIDNQSYPYLRAIYTTLPRAISGKLNTLDPITAATYPIANQTIRLATNGSIIGSTQTGANGFYYLLTHQNAISDTYPFLAYVSGSATTKGNVISVAPPAGGSITNLPIVPNTVSVAENGVVTPINAALYPSTTALTYEQIKTYLAADPYFVDMYGPYGYRNFITNDYLVYALGSLTGSDFLYTTAPSSDIIIKSGSQFQTGNNVNYGLTGNLTATNGTITFNGMVQVGPTQPAYLRRVTVKTNTSGDIVNNAFTFWTFEQSHALTLNSANKILIQKPMLGDIILQSMGPWDPVNSIRAPGPLGVVPYIPISPPARLGLNSTLTLSAAYIPQSVMATADIVVTNFQLLQGKWFQIATPSYPLFNAINAYALTPGFDVNGNFRLGTTVVDGSGNIINTANVEFLRVGGGTGTLIDPFLIMDFYGMQGINSNTYTLSQSYQLFNKLGFYQTSSIAISFWNSGRGFVPIGNALTPFTGTFDGASLADPTGTLYGPPNPDTNPVVAQMIIINPTIWATAKNVGLFGVNAGTIKNINAWGLAIQGAQNVGLVGTNLGTILNTTIADGYVHGGMNVGAIAGVNSGTITNGIVMASAITGTTNVGGVVGNNSGNVDQVLFNGYIHGTTMVGGIAGVNSGTITNSAWDTDASGQSQPTGNQVSLPTVLGGCFDGNCTNGGTYNLTSKSTYTNIGWDFTNTWGIDPDSNHGFVLDPASISFPYLQSAFPNGLRTFRGMTYPAVANQPMFAIGYIFRPNGTLAYIVSSEFPTGADGSFIILVPSRGFSGDPGVFNGSNIIDASDNQIMVVTAVGGTAQGTILGILPPNSYGFTNLEMPTSPLPGGTPLNGVLTFLQAAALFTGLDLNALLSTENSFDISKLFTQQFRILGYESRDLLYSLFGYQNVFSVLYGEDDNYDFANYFYAVDKNMQSLLKDFSKNNPYSFDKYQVIPDGCK